METKQVTGAIAGQAARLRASYNIRTPDAIQIGTALNSKASHFLTNDVNLPNIESIKILFLDSLISI
jgi:predicted nucleic acid-binding protein